MIKVTEKLWRGPRPKSLQDLKEKGFERLIDLQSGLEDCFTDSVYEHEDPMDFGIDKTTYCWSSIFPPTEEEVSEFLFEVGLTGQKTYVHCHSGVDRTGFAIACYRMRKMGWNFDRAHQEFVDCGRHWWFSWWKHALKHYELTGR